MSTNDSNDSKLEEMLTMLESLQAELEEKQKANFEALTNISKLSSENSTLRNELQKKSDTIVSLNKKLKDQSLVEGDRVRSEEAMAEAQKARSEAEQIRADLEGKEEELDNREAEIERQESELSQEIEKEAEILTEGLRHDLEAEFKRKEDHIWQMSLKREHATADKYKKLTIRYQAEFTIVLFYAVIATALKVITTPEITTDAIKFFVNLWNTLVGFVVDVIGFGHTVAGISQLIPNPTVAGIVFWVLQILISAVAIGIVFLTIYSLLITYVRYMKANQSDRLFDYVEGREVKIDNNKVLTAFNVMREVMEQDIALYEEKCKKNKLAAEKRWGKKTANAMQTHTDAIHMDGDNDYVNEYDNENVYEYDIDDDIDIAQPRQEIVPINVSDVINEAKKQGYDIPEEEAESFINYYFVERRGMLDGQPIRNWKNLIEGWYNHIYVDPKDVLGEGSKVFNTLPIDLQNQVFDEQEITTYKITKGTAKKIKDYLASREVV